MTGPEPPADPNERVMSDPPPIAAEPPETLLMPDPPSEVPAVPVAGSERPTSPLAVWSMVLAFAPLALGAIVIVVVRAVGLSLSSSRTVGGLLGPFVLGSYVGGVVIGLTAIRRIKRADGQLKGLGLASVGLGASLLSIVALVALTVVDLSDDELLRDDFEGSQSFWAGEDATVAKSYQHGGYEILVKDPDAEQLPSRSFFDEPAVQALSFAADVVIVHGPQDMAIGLGCWQSKSSGYMVFVGRNGDYAITNATGLLTQGRGQPLRDIGATNRISIACEGADPGPMLLRLSVNGEEVVRYEDPGGDDPFVAVGFYVGSSEAGTLVRFDNALAERR